MTADDIAAELKARGVDPNNPPPQDNSVSPQLDDIAAELKRRGVQLPEVQPPSTLPQYSMMGEDPATHPIAHMIATGLGTGLEALSSPLQVAGETIRRAIEPLQGKDPGPIRAPTVLQRMFPKLQTAQQAPDMFSAIVNPAYAGLKGLNQGAVDLAQGKGIIQSAQNANAAVQQPPGAPEAALSTAAAIGSGEAGNLPYAAVAKPFVELGKMIDSGEFAGIPGLSELAKAHFGLDALPTGLKNLTAPADPELLALQKSEDPNVAKAAKSLLPAAMTGSPTLSAIEGFISKAPFASNIMKPEFTKTLNALNNLKEPLIEGAKPAADLGLDVQQALSNSSNMAYKNAQSLYQNAADALPEGAQIPLGNVQRTASDILKSQAKLPAGAQTSKAAQLLRDLAGSGYESQSNGQIMPVAGQAASNVPGPAAPAFDYQTIQGLRAELNNRIAESNAALGSQTPGAKFQSSPDSAIYTQLKQSLDKDLNSFSDQTGGTFKSAQTQANAAYSTYKNFYKNDKFIQSLMNEQNPENVVDKITKAAVDNPKALGTLKLNLPTQTLNDLQTTFLKGMTEKDPGFFSPNHFVTQYNKVGEDRLTDILGPQKMAQLKPLYLISKAAKQAEALGQAATGPSGAGVTSGMMLRAPITGLISGIASGNPAKGALAGAAMGGAELGTLPLLAEAYKSNAMRNFLTRQTVMPSMEAEQGAAKAAGKISVPVQDLLEQLKKKYADRNKF